MQSDEPRDEERLVRDLFQKAKGLLFAGQFILSFVWLFIFWVIVNATNPVTCRGPVMLFGRLGKHFYTALAAWNVISVLIGSYFARKARRAQENANDAENQQQGQQNQVTPPRWLFKVWRFFNFSLVLLWVYSLCANISRSSCSGQWLGVLSLFFMIHPVVLGICSICGCAVYLTVSETGRSLSESRLRRMGGGMPYQHVEYNQPPQGFEMPGSFT